MVEYVGSLAIILGVLTQFWPVWVGLVIVLVPSFMYKKRLGLYGQLFDSGVGIVGVAICFFWLFTAIFAGQIAPFDPLGQFAIMKDALPGGDRTGLAKGVPVRRRQARPRRVQPHGLSAARSC